MFELKQDKFIDPDTKQAVVFKCPHCKKEFITGFKHRLEKPVGIWRKDKDGKPYLEQYNKKN